MEQWHKLSSEERELWIAYELSLNDAADTLAFELAEKKLLTAVPWVLLHMKMKGL